MSEWDTGSGYEDPEDVLREYSDPFDDDHESSEPWEYFFVSDELYNNYAHYMENCGGVILSREKFTEIWQSFSNARRQEEEDKFERGWTAVDQENQRITKEVVRSIPWQAIVEGRFRPLSHGTSDELPSTEDS